MKKHYDKNGVEFEVGQVVKCFSHLKLNYEKIYKYAEILKITKLYIITTCSADSILEAINMDLADRTPIEETEKWEIVKQKPIEIK